MLTATKNSRQIIYYGTIASGSSISSSQDISMALGGTLNALIETGSSVDYYNVSYILVEVANTSTGSWRKFSKVENENKENTKCEFVFEIPASVMHLQVTIDNNDNSNSITGEATLQELTSIG